MLKSVSSITNALGALNYKGAWDASTNSPALASGVGTKGDYYVVSVAGSTTLDGISNWGVGDWAVFNGSVWQRVEGGADVNAVNLTVSGFATIGTLTVGRGTQTSVATNTAVGYQALNSASLTGVENTGLGYQALFSATTGIENIAVGQAALYSLTTGVGNTAVGLASLFSTTTGGSNTVVGRSAGSGITTGSRNTVIGRGSAISAVNGTDQTVVGEGLTGKGNDTAFIGGVNGAYNEKNVTTWETTSDARIKKDIADFSDGLEVIEQIRVRTFQYRAPGEITELPASAAVNQSGVQMGVIAQELQNVLPECVTENSTGVLSVNTDPLVWYLINAVKQLSAEIKTLKGM